MAPNPFTVWLYFSPQAHGSPSLLEIPVLSIGLWTHKALYRFPPLGLLCILLSLPSTIFHWLILQIILGVSTLTRPCLGDCLTGLTYFSPLPLFLLYDKMSLLFPWNTIVVFCLTHPQLNSMSTLTPFPSDFHRVVNHLFKFISIQVTIPPCFLSPLYANHGSMVSQCAQVMTQIFNMPHISASPYRPFSSFFFLQ